MDALNTKIKNIKTEKTTKIRPENIKSGVNILGISGSVVELQGEIKNVTPSTSAQTITPSTGKNGITQVNVSAVDNTIDNNIQSSNIKSGATILGISGSSSVVDTSDANATASDIVTNKTAYVNGQKITGNYAGIIPSGTINITDNGTVDVTNYASADVSVSSGGGNNNVLIDLTASRTLNNDKFLGAVKSIDGMDISTLTSLDTMFYNCVNMESIGALKTSSSLTNMYQLFAYCKKLTSVDLSQFNTQNVTDMRYVFAYCLLLPTLDLSTFNTKNATSFYCMFQHCEALQSITFGSNFSFEKATGGQGLNFMFSSCGRLDNNTLNAILGLLPTVTSAYTGQKKLSLIGFSSAQISTAQGLSNWAAASAAGWLAS